MDENKPKKLNNKFLLPSDRLLKNKSISEIIYSQKKATENVFSKKIYHSEALKLKKEMKKHWENYSLFLF